MHKLYIRTSVEGEESILDDRTLRLQIKHYAPDKLEAIIDGFDYGMEYRTKFAVYERVWRHGEKMVILD